MLPPDLALALLINRTTQAYQTNAPAYISYRERTHITTSTGRTQEIDRSVLVRNSDNFAIMRDLPAGGEHLGPAFPIIPYFDAFSQFSLGYFANLKAVNIDLQRKDPLQFPIPAPDPGVDIAIPYATFWAPRYAPDSTETALHFDVDPTPRTGDNSFYPSNVREDPATRLPARVELRDTGSDMVITLDYAVINGHWIITHGTFAQTQHVAIFGTFKVKADTAFDQFAFSDTPPDPRLGAPPSQQPDATPSAAHLNRRPHSPVDSRGDDAADDKT
jgi:hypothetical protein